jgi:hypothetical protein
MISTLGTSPVGHAVNRLAGAVLSLLDDRDSREAVPTMQAPVVVEMHKYSSAPVPTMKTPPSSPDQTPPSPISVASTSDTTRPPESVKDLTPFITTLDNHPFSHGGYSVVYKAVLHIGVSKEIVRYRFCA